MNINISKFLALAITAGLSCSPYSATAQTSDPEWLNALNFQMERDEQCEVAYYIRIDEGELGADKTFEARLQCVDGRQFDATRIGEFDDFEIRRCEVETC
ncbi:MAG: hypothetical protein WBC71_02710 [Salaquimonas sp.]